MRERKKSEKIYTPMILVSKFQQILWEVEVFVYKSTFKAYCTNY